MRLLFFLGIERLGIERMVEQCGHPIDLSRGKSFRVNSLPTAAPARLHLPEQ
jgi:hypothetical protein